MRTPSSAQRWKEEFVLVIGVGPIGLAVVQFSVEKGAQVIVLDTNETRLKFCRNQLHVAHVIDAKENLLEALKRITSGDLPIAVFDATGNPKSMEAFGYPAHGGRLIFVGLFQGEVAFNDPDFHRRELTLLGSRNTRPEDFPPHHPADRRRPDQHRSLDHPSCRVRERGAGVPRLDRSEKRSDQSHDRGQPA